MSIKVKNYMDGETVNTNLVLLRGYFIGNCGCKCIQIDTRVKNTIWAWKQMPTQKILHCFSAICELAPGENKIKFDMTHIYPDKSQCSKRLIKNTDEINLIYVPSINNICIQPLLVYCSEDKHLLPDGEDLLPSTDEDPRISKLSIALKLVQTFYSEKLNEYGFERKSFTYLPDSSVIPVGFQLNISKENWSKLDTQTAWQTLALEISKRPTIYNENCKYVAFVLSPWKNILDKTNETPGFSTACDLAIAGTALALMPYLFTSTWPEHLLDVYITMDNEDPIFSEHYKYLGMHSKIGQTYSTTMGCLAHEIGHLYDLGHSSGGLMGSDYCHYKLCFQPSKTYTEIHRADQNGHLTGKFKPLLSFIRKNEAIQEKTTLELNAAVLLYFHRGFQPDLNPACRPCSLQCVKEPFKFIIRNCVIYSSCGISVIDLRLNDGNVIRSWTFEFGAKVFKFPLTQRDIPDAYLSFKGRHEPEFEIVAEDIHGSMVKQCLKLGSIPRKGFTNNLYSFMTTNL